MNAILWFARLRLVPVLVVCLVLFSAVALAGEPAAAAAKRVVALSPNISDTIFLMEAGEVLVGISDFCDPPAQFTGLRRCGGWSNTNFEVLAALRPDLILVLGESPRIENFGASRGIAVHGFKLDNVKTINEDVTRIGELVGRPDAAKRLLDKMNGELAALRAEMPTTATVPSVFLSIDRKPGSLADIFTAAGGSFLDEAITLAGGRNIFHDLTNPYPKISKESLVARRPDVILELVPRLELDERRREEYVVDWRGLPSLAAVKTKRIYVLNHPHLLTPGPRLPEIVRALRAALAK